uniref:Si:ch211-159i8.4 n=1 Tax=Cyprinodon variegatus TaxID=28743 RepID=A0A3Q2CV87_CYPVA
MREDGSLKVTTYGLFTGLKPTHRPWPYLHPWGHGSFVTNPPEIIADTVKPTPTFSGTHISKLLPTSVYHHQDHHVDSRTQTRDHLFMSKLRNRYRQVKGGLCTWTALVGFRFTAKLDMNKVKTTLRGVTMFFRVVFSVCPPGATIPANTKHGPRFEVFRNGTFFIKNVQLQDRGQYLCTAHNRLGSDRMVITLTVQTEAPRILPPPSAEVSIYIGKAVALDCLASGKPPAQISWILPDRTFVREVGAIQTNLSPISLLPNGTLRIHSANFSSKGDYKCIASNAAGADTVTYRLHVAALPPSISEGVQDSVIQEEDNICSTCVTILPDGTLINNALQSDDSGLRNRRFVMYENGTLLLRQMGRKDEGDYTCHATNKLGKDERRLSVKVGPNAPQIGLKSQSLVKVKLGESATLSCQATGEPKPKITWISPKTDVIPQLSDKYRVIDDGTLILKKMTLADEGKYACVARNSAGDDIKNMIVEAELQEPFINGVRGKLTAKLLAVSYQTALLDCKAEGKPEPRVWWLTPYGHALTTPYLGGRFQVHRNGSLELRGVRKTDAGRYNCFAKNHLGEASLSVELEVASLAEKPSFANPNIEILPIKQDGGELILVCPARGTPIPEISWLLPNGTVLSPGKRLHRFTHHFENGTLRISQPVPTDKGIYRCLARNVAGQVEKRYSLEAGWKPVIRGTTGMMLLLKT